MIRLSLSVVAALLFMTSLSPAAPADSVRLVFSFEQDPDIYEESDYGEAPQVAIWLEDIETGAVRTVYVTYRTAAGDFYGKVECPVSLPAWILAWRGETGRNDFPTPRNPSADAITKATGEAGLVKAEAVVPRGARYLCYLEMNVAGDFNAAYPFENADGRLDYHGNGQPSLVYRGEIVAEPGKSFPLPVFGRTEHYQFPEGIIEDVEGFDNALECLRDVKVTCKEN